MTHCRQYHAEVSSTVENDDILSVVFIRHAQTDYKDIGDRDNCDGNLTETGEKQCELLGERLKDMPIDGYISSSLLRAFKTAVGVCKAKSDEPLIQVCPEIIECGCTQGYYGCTEEYLNKYYGKTKMINLFGTDGYSFGCVSDEENDLRAQKLIDYIKDNYTYGQRVAVFSHHGMLSHLVPTALGIKSRELSYSFDNVSLTEVEYRRDGKTVLKYANK